MYLIVWEFVIRAECKDEFESVYGPHGEWVRLFGRSHGYQRTLLLHDSNASSRYITLDFWASRQEYERFQREHEAEYRTLDERCADLPVKETRLGEFEAVS